MILRPVGSVLWILLTQCLHGPQRVCFVDGFYSNLRFLLDRLLLLSELTRQIQNSTDIVIAMPDFYYSYQASGFVMAKHGPIRYGDLFDISVMQESPLFSHRRVQFVNEEEFWLKAAQQSRPDIKRHFITALNKQTASCARPLKPCCNYTALPPSAKCREYMSLHEALPEITGPPTGRQRSTTLLFVPSSWSAPQQLRARPVVPLFRTKIFEAANNSSWWREAIPASLLHTLAALQFGPAVRESAAALLAKFGVNPAASCQQNYKFSQRQDGYAHAARRALRARDHRSGDKVLESCPTRIYIAVHMRRGNTYGIGGQSGQANLHEIVWALCRTCDELSTANSSCARGRFKASHKKSLTPLARFLQLVLSFVRTRTTHAAKMSETPALKNSDSQRMSDTEPIHVLIFAILSDTEHHEIRRTLHLMISQMCSCRRRIFIHFVGKLAHQASRHKLCELSGAAQKSFSHNCSGHALSKSSRYRQDHLVGLLLDSVEVQLMRDSNFFIGTRSTMSAMVFAGRTADVHYNPHAATPQVILGQEMPSTNTLCLLFAQPCFLSQGYAKANGTMRLPVNGSCRP